MPSGSNIVLHFKFLYTLPFIDWKANNYNKPHGSNDSVGPVAHKIFKERKEHVMDMKTENVCGILPYQQI